MSTTYTIIGHVPTQDDEALTSFRIDLYYHGDRNIPARSIGIDWEVAWSNLETGEHYSVADELTYAQAVNIANNLYNIFATYCN